MNLKNVKIEKVLFDGNQINIYHVTIRPDEYKICVDCACNMWANKKEGILNTVKDPYKTERTGRLGEMAFSKIFGLPLDTEYKEYGDTMDFFYKENKINVKCAARYPDWEAGLVKTADEYGNSIPLKQDLYVFGYLKNEKKDLCQANIVLIGYQSKDFIEKLSEKNARIGSHYNREVPYSSLIDIKLI